jgi:polar amino acid transport system substrate-binding protein
MTFLRLSVCIAVLIWASPVAAGTLQDIRSQGVLKWGADAEGGAPYVFPDPDHPDRLIGFEVDLAAAIAGELGVKAQMVQTDWSALLSGLQRGDYHIAMNGIEWTEERHAAVEFSRPYYLYQQQLVVRQDESRIQSFDDLSGHVVGTLEGSVAQSLLQKTRGVEVRFYTGQVEPYRDLAQGRLDAVFMDLPIAAHYARPNPRLRFAGSPLGEGLYVIALPKREVALKAEIDRVLRLLYANGTLKSIYQKWGLWNQAQLGLGDSTPRARRVFASEGEGGFGLYLSLLIQGAGMTVLISVTGMALAILLGGMVTLLRLHGVRWIKPLTVSYVEIMRGTPLLLQLYILYYGLPNIGIRFDAFTAAVLGLGMNYAAYESEIFRASLATLPPSQGEAARSLGMGPFMIYRRILIPQAVRVALPPVTNDFIALFKDSSLVSIIAIVELTKAYNMLAVSSLRFLELGLLTAALYLMMSIPLSILSTRLERRLDRG